MVVVLAVVVVMAVVVVVGRGPSTPAPPLRRELLGLMVRKHWNTEQTERKGKRRQGWH